MISDKKYSLNGESYPYGSIIEKLHRSTVNGFFFFFTTNGWVENVEHCREVFEYRSRHRGRAWIGFACRDLNINLLNQCFELMENQLGLEKPTTFYRVNGSSRIVVIRLSRFWNTDYGTRAVMTLMLRYGAVYYRNSFWLDMRKYDLAYHSIRALARFFLGYTKWVKASRIAPDHKHYAYKPRYGRFCWTFGGEEGEFVNQALIKP